MAKDREHYRNLYLNSIAKFKTSKFSYKENLYHHAWTRARERYNLFIDLKVYNDLNEKITKRNWDDTLFSIKKTKARRFCVALVKGTWTLLVFNKRENAVASFLPIDNLERYYGDIRPSQIAFFKRRGLLMSDEEWLNKRNLTNGLEKSE